MDPLPVERRRAVARRAVGIRDRSAVSQIRQSAAANGAPSGQSSTVGSVPPAVLDREDARYAEAAPLYWRAGWTGVLPLPYRSKRPVPAGWTGHGRAYPDDAAIQAWCRTHSRGNLALRMPQSV